MWSFKRKVELWVSRSYALDNIFTGFKIKIMKKTKQEEIKVLKRMARELYKKGFTTREVGKQIGRSHAWVALVVKE